eukprot:m.25211 g.25211  ORF g.25211 m.25211 type:complete len:550 (-) comp11432_c0_seq2:49-1698(-)
MPTDKKTAFAQGEGSLNLANKGAGASTPAPSAAGAAASPFGVKKLGDGGAVAATSKLGGGTSAFGGGAKPGATGFGNKAAGAKPFGASSTGGGGAAWNKSGATGTGGAFGGGAKSGGVFGSRSPTGGAFGKSATGGGGAFGGGAARGGQTTWNDEWAKVYRLVETTTAKKDEEESEKDKAQRNVLDTVMEPEVLELVANLQEHIHQQNLICKDVQRTLSEPKSAQRNKASVTDQIRDLQQKLLMIDNKALKSSEDIKSLRSKTEKETEFVMMLQQDMLQPRDGYDHSSSSLVYRYYTGMVLDWEHKIGGYQAQVTTLQRRLQPSISSGRTVHDEIEGLQVLLHEQQRAFVQLSARLHEIHEKIEQACGRVRPSLNLQTVKQEVSALYDNLSQGGQRSQPKRILQADAAAVQQQVMTSSASTSAFGGGAKAASGWGAKPSGVSGSPFAKTGAAGAKPGGIFGAKSGAAPSTPFGSKTASTPAPGSTPFGGQKPFGGAGQKPFGGASAAGSKAGGVDLNSTIKPGGFGIKNKAPAAPAGAPAKGNFFFGKP